MPRIVLAYSGGLDTSIILKWLMLERGFDVVTMTADVGQTDDIEGIRRKALATGAVSAAALDLRAEFARDFVFPMMRAAPVYEGYYLLGTSIARPVIARHLTQLAMREDAVAISHGSTGKGNDQVRFELAAYATWPDVKVVAPWREWDMKGRADLETYARQHGISVPTTIKDPWSHDGNLLHSSYEGGILEDPWAEPPAHLFKLTAAPESAPDVAQYVEITMRGGNAVALDGAEMEPHALIAALNVIAGRHGVGRVDMVENRYVGIKSRGVYETPGGTMLHHARRAVESLTLDREVLHQRDALSLQYAKLVYNGYWFAPERETLQTYFDGVAKAVTGTARLKLYKGTCQIVGRKSDVSLYDLKLATFEAEDAYRQADADGFIRINALRIKAHAKAQARQGGL